MTKRNNTDLMLYISEYEVRLYVTSSVTKGVEILKTKS
jgi:hypothetical protein